MVKGEESSQTCYVKDIINMLPHSSYIDEKAASVSGKIKFSFGAVTPEQFNRNIIKDSSKTKHS